MENERPIVIDLTKYNKLSFNLSLEGSGNEELQECKFIIQDKEISFMFDAVYNEETESFNVLIPPMKTNLKESVLYKSKLQVMIDGQTFEPLEIFITGKEKPKVKVANFQNESVKSKAEKLLENQSNKLTVSVNPIRSKRQILESMLRLKEEISSLEPDSEEFNNKKEEYNKLIQEYKILK
jgi:hypothetical protein